VIVFAFGKSMKAKILYWDSENIRT
jgi:hypothetical protein